MSEMCGSRNGAVIFSSKVLTRGKDCVILDSSKQTKAYRRQLAMFSNTLDQLTETLHKLQNEAAVLKSQGLRGGKSLSDDQKLALTILSLQCRQLNELIKTLAPSLPD